MDDELLFRYLLRQASATEQGAVAEWLRASAENEKRLAGLARMLTLLERDEATLEPPARPAVDDILRRAGDRSSGWPRRRVAFGLAAAAVLFVAAALTLARIGPSRGFDLGAGEFATGAGETARVQLGDGSVLRLAPSSRLRVTEARNERVVSLEGRAFFVVARMDDDHPFEVRTRAGAVKVLGTRFDLEAGPDSLALLVVEGRVAVSAGGDQVTVNAGQLSEVRKGRLLDLVRVTDVETRVAWAGKFLVFQGEPLAEVATQIAEHYGVTVHIVDPALARRTVKAWITDESLDQAVTVICTIVDADCSTKGDSVTMRAR